MALPNPAGGGLLRSTPAVLNNEVALLVLASKAAIVSAVTPAALRFVNAGPPATLCAKSVTLGNPPGPRLGLNALDKLSPVIESKVGA